MSSAACSFATAALRAFSAASAVLLLASYAAATQACLCCKIATSAGMPGHDVPGSACNLFGQELQRAQAKFYVAVREEQLYIHVMSSYSDLALPCGC